MERRLIYDGFVKLESVETPYGRREFIEIPDSVSVLIHDVDGDRLLLIRQPRVAVMVTGRPDGLITETVAGLLDPGHSVIDQIVQEAAEEADIRLRPDDIELLNGGTPLALSSGVITERTVLAYAPVHVAQIGPERDHYGVPDEGEHIQRVWVSINDIDRIPCEDLRAFTLLQWFHTRHGR